MWPIKSEMKSRRIKFDAPQDPISWAYMKELREHDKTKKVYAVNPYVEVYQFRDSLYALLTENNDGGGDVWMWLIIGPKKAMLVDTAYGLGDMKGLVDKITGKMPLIVANTHVGPDNVLGNCRFDTVYCHEFDLEAIKDRSKPGAWDCLFDKNGNNIWLQFDRKDLPVYREYTLIPVKDGHVFNLGGDYNVELVWTAGHTPGQSMFLDKGGRYLFTGDDVISDTINCGSGPTPGRPNGQYANLTTYRDCLKRLATRLDEFDYMFSGHFISNAENHLLLTILDTLNEIIADPSKYDYKATQAGGSGGPGRERMYKFVRGFGTIAYTQSGIFPPRG